jgi:universal stress protein E
MQSIRKILVAIKDPDSHSQPGADKALRIAARLGAAVEFFNAISNQVLLDVAPLNGTSLAGIKREALQLRQARIDKLVARARKLGVPAAGTVTWDYPPYEAIVRRARAARADLIIAEAHDSHRLQPWLMRLTDWELLRTSPVPVLLLKSRKPWRRSPVFMAAVDPLHVHDKPAALDDAIVAAAGLFSAKFAGNVIVAHASYPPLQALALADPVAGAATLAAMYEAQKAESTAAFSKFCDRHYLRAANRLLVDAPPASGIPRVAREQHADLVVMGAISRSGLKRVFIGNTAERVLATLPCDVLVIKPKKFRTAVTAKPRGMRVVATVPLVPLGA